MDMKKLLSLTFACVGLWASAAINPAEFTELEFDKEYSFKQYKEFKGKITPSESGVVIEYGHIPAHTLTSSGELEIVADWTYAGYIKGKQAYQFHVTAGTTYYIYSDFLMDDGTMSLSLNPAVKVLGVDPAEGSVFDIAAKEYASVFTNQNITIGNATLTIGANSTAVAVRTYGSDTSILIRDVLDKWYDSGLINGGEKIEILLSDITDALGQSADDISLTYIAAGAPYKLLESTIPDPVFSWFTPNNANAVATFVFSGPVAPNPSVELCYSPIELGYEYIENIQATVNGNTITVDLAGKLRTPDLMSPTGTILDYIDIRLSEIKDTRGQYMLASEGSIGSYQFRTAYTNIEPVNFAVQFTPDYGSSLVGETEIAIAYNNPDKLDFTALVFTSGNDKVKIAKSDLAIASGLIKAAIPDGWQTRSNVFVSLEGIETADGIDHSAEFIAKYNGFALLFSNPANGASLPSLAKERTITIDTNLDSGEEVTFTLTDGSGVIYGPCKMTQRAEGQYIHVMESEVTLYVSETYLLTFSARGTTETVRIYGQSVPFEHSDIELATVLPDEGATLKGGDAITLTFTGLVYIEQVSGSVDFTTEGRGNQADETGNGYDYIWELTLPAQLPATDFDVKFTATDENAMLVKGNAGSDSTSHFILHYNAEAGIFELLAPDSGSLIFDINGRRMTAPVRGINIINGKKVLVK